MESKQNKQKPFYITLRETENEEKETKTTKKKYTLEELADEPFILYEGKRVYTCLEPIIYWQFCICERCGRLKGTHSDKEIIECNLDAPYEETDDDSSSTYYPSSDSSYGSCLETK